MAETTTPIHATDIIAQPGTIWQHLRPAWAESFGGHALAIAGGIALITIGAYISVPNPMGVPTTLQTLAVMLVAMCLGSRLGIAAVASYLTLGIAGAPVFSPSTLHISLTAGFLGGFLVAAFVTGSLAERGWDRSLWRSMIAMLAGGLTVLVCGWAYLAVGGAAFGLALNDDSAAISVSSALGLFVAPFILIEIIKSIVGGVLLPAARKVIRSS
ncbi:MAG: biotin transporter BioY [Planctomycetota bacterium]